MTYANTSGAVALAAGMAAYVKALPAPMNTTSVVFGWKAREQILNQGWNPGNPSGGNRIVVVPGDPESGDGGPLERGKIVSSNPRTLLNWRKRITLCIWGAAGASDAALRDDRQQAAAVEALIEIAVQAVHHAVDPDTGNPVGLANIEWGGTRWNMKQTKNLAFGRELFVYLTQKGPLFDQPEGIAYPGFALAEKFVPTMGDPYIAPIVTGTYAMGNYRVQVVPVNVVAAPAALTIPPVPYAQIGDFFRVMVGVQGFDVNACTLALAADGTPLQHPQTGAYVTTGTVPMTAPDLAWKLEKDSRGGRWSLAG